MASPVKIQNFRYGVHLKFIRAFYTRPGINRVKYAYQCNWYHLDKCKALFYA